MKTYIHDKGSNGPIIIWGMHMWHGDEMDKLISVEYLRHEDTITAYVITEGTAIATAVLNGKMHEDTNNQREPFEYLQHTFDFDMSTLSSCGAVSFKT